MKININQKKEEGAPKKGGVYIAPNLIRTSERLDKDGNIIDPRTKRIIKRNGDTE